MRRGVDSSRIRVLEDSMSTRASKMRRFCNYFVTLYNMDKINPFSQFVQGAVIKQLKVKVRQKMEDYNARLFDDEEEQKDTPKQIQQCPEAPQKPAKVSESSFPKKKSKSSVAELIDADPYQ